MRGFLILLAVLWPLVLAAQTEEATPTAPPVDEAERDESFLAYRGALLTAVVARNVDAIVGMSAEDIVLSFGGAEGHAALRAFLEVDAEQFSPEQKHEAPAMRERNWYELETVLRLGGVFNAEGEFVAPYTWSVQPPEGIDPFEVMFITGNGVALRDRPIRFGDVVTRLNYDVVKFRNWVTGTQFLEIEMGDGVDGFVHRDFARFLVDYRAVFAKRDGVWKMIRFVAGD